MIITFFWFNLQNTGQLQVKNQLISGTEKREPPAAEPSGRRSKSHVDVRRCRDRVTHQIQQKERIHGEGQRSQQ